MEGGVQPTCESIASRSALLQGNRKKVRELEGPIGGG